MDTTLRPEKWLSLDFANTLYWRTSDNAKEQLQNYEDLVDWSKTRHLLTPNALRQLLDLAKQQPTAANKVFQSSLAIRETIYRIFSSTTKHRKPSREDIQKLNEVMATFLPNLRLSIESASFEWDWKGDEIQLDAMLWPIAKSAADLLTSGNLKRVRECANTIDGCGWLFFDETKNSSRKWCHMQVCGNRMKSRRHYKRRVNEK